MASCRRGRFIAIVIALAVVTLCVSLWVNEGPIWWLVMTKKVPIPHIPRSLVPSSPININTQYQRGWMTVKRWTHPQVVHGIAVAYWISNGLKSFECEIEQGIPIRTTCWRLDGSVQTQARHQPGENKDSPPWWWPVEDQTKPMAPWWDHEKNRAKE